MPKSLIMLGLCLAVLLGVVGPTPGTPATAAPVRADDAWRGEYFNNQDLTGAPVLVRYDRDLRFEWGLRAPGPGVRADNFSVRWTRTVQLDWTGNYRFYANTDDGVRVWVDDLLIIDEWHDRQDAWLMVDLYLASGQHRLKVEYYEHEGAAMAKLVYQPEASAPWKGEYYTNIELDGAPGRTDYLQTLEVDWGDGAPGEWFHPDWFSARFTRDIFMAAGSYKFVLTVEGGARVWVDGGLVIDQWRETNKTTHTGTATLGSGNHKIEVQYYETHRRASLRFSWQPVVSPITGWKGEYYPSPDLSGPAVLARDDKAIDFNWGEGAPATGLPSDSFSVRWTRHVAFSPAGYYLFAVTADDGIRIWVDEHLILDEWHSADSAAYLASPYLSAGTHTVRVEYNELAGRALVRVNWQRANTTATQAQVDDKDMSFTRGGPEAGWSTLSAGIGGRAWRALNQAGWWARWTPALPQPGRYEVFVYVPWTRNATQHALYYVKHEGDVTTLTVDQQSKAGSWVSLGTYGFNANGTEFVHLDGVTVEEAAGSRSIVFDAAKWVRRGN